VGYTLAYGRSYDEWVREKARRIYSYLYYVWKRKIPIDVQDLAEVVYRERLLGLGTLWGYRVPKYRWKPILEAFTDFKPSPFIKNFLMALIKWLREKGYIDEYGIVVRLPSYHELVDFCSFHPDPYQQP